MGRDVSGGMPDRHYVDSDPYVVVGNALGKADQSLVLPVGTRDGSSKRIRVVSSETPKIRCVWLINL